MMEGWWMDEWRLASDKPTGYVSSVVKRHGMIVLHNQWFLYNMGYYYFQNFQKGSILRRIDMSVDLHFGREWLGWIRVPTGHQ